ncbi:hypothetical protein DPMN_004076 [Dreissena polymorpha]|uniref:Uncharacterized protein n=1 Tax=Dreissena polymorpha TaxID=45954 RepID=A0A9D4MQY1_DREPO|nr:hypothetical protein DPMN_004076 [Dreissena polymorpha]
MGVIDFTTSLWRDPYRWSLVKSVALFSLAVFIAHEFEAAELEAAAETAAKLGSR